MGIIITKLKRLRRRSNKQLIWSGNHRPKGGKGFLVEFQYNRIGRYFYAQIAERETSKSPWKRGYDASPEQVEYLKSLLTQEELAKCVAASILHREPATQTHVMRSAKLSMCDAHGNAIPIHNDQLPALKGP